MGIEVREQRKIYLQPLANAWRHFRESEKSNIRIPEHEAMFFVLQLLKPIYDTVGAPLLWQLALTLHVTDELKGVQSVFDDNFFMWVKDSNIRM
eukprot:4000192-Pyramimonas_sp.AAC.1